MNKNRISFLIAYPFIFLISKLPLFILYGISNLIYYVLYYVIGYRKQVVRKNLTICFPDKTEKEKLEIEKKSFRHFVDIFIEMLKGFGISQKELSKRYIYKNPEIFKEIEASGKSVIILAAHHGNWEWLININKHTSLKCYGAYKKIKNPYFNEYIKENRARFGSIVVPTKDTISKITSNYKNHIQSVYGLLSDQSPQVHKTHYWSTFFNEIVPVHTGAEMLAKRFDFNMIYMRVKMPKRGYYEVTFEKLNAPENSDSKYPITDIYLKKVEQDISQNPSIYFWTHKRFKHRGKQPKS